MSISGLPHLAHFLLRSAKFHQTHLVGRLKLLEKLVEMHCETVANWRKENSTAETATISKDTCNRRISYRHLCSSLIFARRHVYPPEQPVFPHNLVAEGAMATRCRRNTSGGAGNATGFVKVPDDQVEEVQVSSYACLMEANIKASRLVSFPRIVYSTPSFSRSTQVSAFQARRVFIAVARALLKEPRSSYASSNGNSSLPDAESFVNAEIRLLDVSLAAKLRAKLADLLNTNTTTAGSVFVKSSTTTAAMATTTVSTQQTAAASVAEKEVPPVPPPRRFSQTKAPALPPPDNKSRIITPSGVRIALEPAYDHVALSETAGVYSSSEEEEDGEAGDEEPLEKLDWEEVGTAQQQQQQHQQYSNQRNREQASSRASPSVPMVPSPAELSALKTALRRAAWSPIPLVTIPNLAQALNAKDPLKTEYRYKEGVDWLLGPFLGKGAFSLCYQARDIRTGTLMAVKRLRFVDDSSTEAMEQLATAREEVEIMRRLYHPNVLRLFGIAYNPEKKHVDIFVEWMPGGSITSLLNQYGAFTESVSLAYILQVIRGISCLHKHGILHRDLKGNRAVLFTRIYLYELISSINIAAFLFMLLFCKMTGANLLIDCTGSVVRISDFGASARLGSQGSVAGQFQGQVIGTFAFMAPEVRDKKR